MVTRAGAPGRRQPDGLRPLRVHQHVDGEADVEPPEVRPHTAVGESVPQEPDGDPEPVDQRVDRIREADLQRGGDEIEVQTPDDHDIERVRAGHGAEGYIPTVVAGRILGVLGGAHALKHGAVGGAGSPGSRERASAHRGRDV